MAQATPSPDSQGQAGTSDLFRQEAISHESNRLHGEVRLDTPISGWVIVSLLSMIVVGAVAAMSVGSYTRTEMVTGWLVPDKGLARISARQGAVVEAVHVQLGEPVRSGTPILMLGSDSGPPSGFSGLEELTKQIERERRALEHQIALVKTQHAEDRAGLENRKAYLEDEREQTLRRHGRQRERIVVAVDGAPHRRVDDHVIARAADQNVVAGEALDDVVAAGLRRAQQHLLHLGAGPDRAVGELDQFHAMPQRGELVGQHHPVATGADGQHQGVGAGRAR